MSAVIFLLGAGASVDAGLPLVAEVTRELRTKLSKERAEFAELLVALEEYEPEIARNYERLFELLAFLWKSQARPFNNVVNLKLEQVMAGLVPAIHVFLPRTMKFVDARDKRGHDEVL